MDKHTTKILTFLSALQDCYKEEGERELEILQKLEFKEEELTDDFIAMLEAQAILYRKITGDEQDLIGFTHILNRLVFQYLSDATE